MTTTRDDLAEIIAQSADISHLAARAVLDCLLNEIVQAVLRDDKVEIRGFGSFRTRQRGPRIGRNPKTGERVEVPSKTVPYFKPGKDIREALLD